MIKIYTKSSLVQNAKVIKDCEAFFTVFVTSIEFTDMDMEVIKAVDDAIVLDKETGAIKTPYGLTTIENLSTGCKVILTYLYIIRNREKYDSIIAIDVTECGYNALDVLFDIAQKCSDDSIVFILRHNNDLFYCQERDYLINNKDRVKDLSFVG